MMTTSLEDYIECIYMLILAKRPARVRDIAAHLNVKTPSVVKAVSTLKEDGYVEQERYGAITLTTSGVRKAKQIFSKHQKLKRFLVELGVSEETAEADGCKMEHILSPETLACIDAFLRRKEEEKAAAPQQ